MISISLIQRYYNNKLTSLADQLILNLFPDRESRQEQCIDIEQTDTHVNFIFIFSDKKYMYSVEYWGGKLEEPLDIYLKTGLSEWILRAIILYIQWEVLSNERRWQIRFALTLRCELQSEKWCYSKCLLDRSDAAGIFCNPIEDQDTPGGPLLVHCCPTGLLLNSSLLVKK